MSMGGALFGLDFKANFGVPTDLYGFPAINFNCIFGVPLLNFNPTRGFIFFYFTVSGGQANSLAYNDTLYFGYLITDCYFQCPAYTFLLDD